MAKQLKSGYLLRYKKRLFGKNWREEYVVLFSDSTIAWFKDKDCTDPLGGLILKDAPDMIAVGQFTLRIPVRYRPELPTGAKIKNIMAFGSRRRDKVHWFICRNEEDVEGWMTAISKTLPPAPVQQQNGHSKSYTPVPLGPSNYQPPMPGQVTTGGPYKPKSCHLSNGVSNGHIAKDGLVCNGHSAPPPACSVQHHVPDNNRTKIVMKNGTGGCGGRGMEMAGGMLVGAALTNWGHGWGWGGGLGFGGGIHHEIDLHNNFMNNTGMFDADYLDADMGGMYDGFDSMDGGMGDFGGDFGGF